MIKYIGKRIVRFLYSFIALLLFYSGFISFYLKKKLRDKFLIVFYHEVGNNIDILGNITTKQKHFEKQIKYLSLNFSPLSINDINCLGNKRNVEGGSFLVTFDGGYSGNLYNAYPVLKKHKTPGLVYIVTESIENGEVPWTTRLAYVIRKTKRTYLELNYNGKFVYKGSIIPKKKSLKALKKKLYKYDSKERHEINNKIAKVLEVNVNPLNNIFLNWEQVNTLAKKELMLIGSHTVTHPRLNQISEVEVKREVFNSKYIIERKTGIRIHSFCYPDGKINESTIKLVKEAGYQNATTTINGFNSSSTNPFMYRRIGGGNMSLPVFALKISGLFKNLNV